MNWRVIFASDAGTSHTAVGGICEDSCSAGVSGPSGQELFTAFVADGAGSAAHGGRGADLAIEAALQFIDSKTAGTEFAVGEQLALDCVLAVRDAIYRQAASTNSSAREYATTFLGVIASQTSSVLFQVGDGGIVVDFGTGLEVPIAPMNGEYANATNFVTDEDAISVLQIKTFQRSPIRLAAFSDGLQRLAMNMATCQAHEPFFSKFFQVLGTALPEQEEQLQQALVNFLRSDAVNERTDDDKSLVLAIRTS